MRAKVDSGKPYKHTVDGLMYTTLKLQQLDLTLLPLDNNHFHKPLVGTPFDDADGFKMVLVAEV